MKEESKVKKEIKKLEGLLNAKREIIRVLKFVDDRFVLNNVMMLLLRAEAGKEKYGTTLESRDLEEKARGLAAKEYVNQMAPSGSVVKLVTKTYDAKGKFGRILGEIVVELEHGTYNVNQMLINEGHATEYFGGKR